ncbi:MAG: T9SS type A sorting domain-containing protein [Ignavibacteria bacterium]|nr:T9SS type A sorting domain-containing protein [Ignavibacteria bacterium]
MGSGGIPDNNDINTINTISTEEELTTPADTLINRMLKGDINSDRNTERNKTNFIQNRQQTGISNEQSKKEFYEKIKTVNNDSKTIQEEKVKTLEKKIETVKDDETKEDARTELTKMKQLNEAIKIKKPDNIKTHTLIINNDIRKVFGIGKKPAKETSTSLLPKTFELYQNYPNPFNPTTKIAFDLPKDAKVKLIIYDILGREVKTLINNEFKSAGKYISEFNGSQLASGIYFARILVNDGKEFIAVKKMVLIK